MAKYPFELKLKIVKEYLSGVGGYRYLANKYGISSKSQVSNWVNAYREYGEEGLLRKHQNQKYSVQFKLNALELYQTSEMSYREVASTLEMNNPALIANWMRNFREAGIEGLSKEKGR
ncbi:transposase, partial [Enterococcus casseliflavus]